MYFFRPIPDKFIKIELYKTILKKCYIFVLVRNVHILHALAALLSRAWPYRIIKVVELLVFFIIEDKLEFHSELYHISGVRTCVQKVKPKMAEFEEL